MSFESKDVERKILSILKVLHSINKPAGGRISRYPDGRLNGELVDTAKSLVTLPPPVRSSARAPKLSALISSSPNA